MSDDGKKWYLWPQGYYPYRYYVPWFVILRRLIFWPLLLAARCMTFIAVTGGFGISEAIREWRKN